MNTLTTKNVDHNEKKLMGTKMSVTRPYKLEPEKK